MKLTQAMIKSAMNRLNHVSASLVDSFETSLTEAIVPPKLTDDQIMDALLDMGNDDLTDLCQRIINGTALDMVNQRYQDRTDAFRLVDSTVADFRRAHQEYLMNIEADLNFNQFDGDPTDSYINALHDFTTETLEDILKGCDRG
jgi:hypothetical protein